MAPPPLRSKPVVLVVDDDSDACELLAEVLARAGMQGLRAQSVDEALTLLEAIVIDAVVTDFAMPEADGLDLLRQLRSDPRCRDVVCAMVSGKGDDRVAGEARALDAIWHPKTLELSGLVRQLHDALAARRAHPAR